MSKRLLSEVLWEAANVHLSTTGYKPRGADLWSCNAALMAEFPALEERIVTRTGIKSLRDESKTDEFLQSLGCDSRSHNAFNFGVMSHSDAQGVRYMWLLLAMHVAESEGIEV